MKEKKNLSSLPVRSRKRATVLQAAGGYVNTAILIVHGLLLVPLYLYFLGANMYGLWLASGGMLGMMGLMNFGISSLLIQRVSRAYGQKNFTQAGAYFINGMVIYFAICLLYVAIGVVVSFWLPAILNVTGEDADLLQQCFQLAVVATTIGIFNECLRSFSQALLRPVAPMIAMAVGRILGIAVTVGMLFYDFGLWAVPMGILIAEGIIFILNLFHTVPLFYKLAVRVTFDRNIIKAYLQTSPALLMARMGNTLSQESEPLLITMFLGPEVTAAYMITRRAADMVFQMMSVIVGSTMGPFAHLAANSDYENISKIAKNLLFFSVSMGAVSFATYVGANHAFVPLWVGDAMATDQNIILFIGLGFFARTIRGFLGQMLYGLGDFFYTSIIILMEGVVRIVLAVGTLNVIGVMGVPLAFTLSCLIAVVVLGGRLRRKLKACFSISVTIRFLLSGAILFGTNVNLKQMDIVIDSWGALSLYIVMLLISTLAMYMLMNWTTCRDTCKDIVA